MNTLIWDGSMDMGWDDLKEYLNQTTTQYVSEALDCAKFSCNPAVQNLINENSMGRFCSVVDALTTDISDAFYYQSEDAEESSTPNSLKLKTWIMLGSALESSMQIFLSIYLADYQSSHWQQWQDFEGKIVTDTLAQVVRELVQNGTIQASQGHSIRSAVKSEINKHTKEHSIDKVMLDELIQFYIQNELLDQDDISELVYPK